MTSTPEFDWLHSPDVALQEQRAIAVYENTVGGLVILQERSWDEEDDTCIFITKTNIDAFIAAVLKAAGREDLVQALAPAEPETRPLTNAERQRRYRNNRRSGAPLAANLFTHSKEDAPLYAAE
ncbi:hypothetical protein [Blastochloris viridis]|uniref:Uncharacterized protein n=1 Tax=Blastochloris viridis TaxID=1079 RepID=A0A0H5BEI0_BLAVI|nr:hypothetical protein [Blastochloris viridis]ALK09492.1 hypothetical protein BVIR_1716 [Blastochloris viridis]BAS00623.1 hypothetical protein BV133_3029 [Blastochloris viridis]CUU42155.1 hypothetical protein BVIRIDIS_11610 [Blastochloris viridis]